MSLTKEQLIEKVKSIHNLTNQGQALKAMEDNYDKGVVMVEDNGDTTVGLQQNLEREKAFFSSVTAMREMKILDTFVLKTPEGEDDIVITTSYMDIDINNSPVVGKQVSITHWNDDGKVVREQFIYQSF